MQTVIDIATITALFSAAALCLYGIATLRDVRGVVKELQGQLQMLNRAFSTLPSDFKEISQQCIRIIGHIEQTTSRLAELTQSLHQDAQQSGGIFAEVEALRQQLRRMREFVELNILQPAQQIATFITAAAQGLAAFLHTLQKQPERRSSTPEQATH
jgi:uncharacterized protein YoxC